MDPFNDNFINQKDIIEKDYKNNKIQDYEKMELIGNGTFSAVYKVKNKRYGDIYAMKIIGKRPDIQKEEQKKQIQREIDNLIKCYHWENNYNTVKLFNHFETKEQYVLVFNYCDTNLELYVKENYKEEKMPIDEIKLLFLELNNGFKNLYEENVIHRDIKINNILIEYRFGDKKDFIPRLADFGISRENSTQFNPMTASISWMLLSAPEILLTGTDYSFASDLWSIGVLLYKLAFGKYPYDGQGAVELYMKIMNNPKKFEKSGNDDFDDLIEKLLEKEKERRITYEDYFKHPFFKYEEPISIINLNEKHNLNVSSYNREFRTQYRIDILRDLSETEFINLKELNLQFCDISNLTPLNADVFKNLVFLNLQYNKIYDLTPMINIKFLNIKQMFFGSNRITNISPLEKIPFNCLEIIGLSGNLINLEDENNKRIIQKIKSH